MRFSFYILAAVLGITVAALSAEAARLNGGGDFNANYSLPDGVTSDPTSFCVGTSCLASITTTGLANVAVGYQALATTNGPGASGVGGNVAVGYGALQMTTTADKNVGVGYLAGNALTTGRRNVLIGDMAGYVATTATGNTGVGAGVLQALTTGTSNAGFGNAALTAVTTGSNNMGIGQQAGNSITTGSNNTIIGQAVSSGANGITTGGYNVIIGSTNTTRTALATTSSAVGIGYNVRPGSGDTAVGFSALATSTTDAQSNSAFGYLALNATTTGIRNTALGAQSMGSNTVGSSNVAIGFNTIYYGTSGTSNTAVGSGAMVGSSGNSLTGSQNTGIGGSAMMNIQTTAASNTAVGYLAGKTITTGSSNVVIGSSVASTTLTTGSNNILIGTSSALDTTTTATSNSLAIASGATKLIYGDTTSGVKILGNTSTGGAPAGYIGELIESTVGATNCPTTGNYGDLTSVSLTAGSWRCDGNISYTINGATMTQVSGGMSTTTGNSATGLTYGDTQFGTVPPTSQTNTSVAIAGKQYLLSGTTTLYLKYQCSYTGGPPQAAGRLSCYRNN